MTSATLPTDVPRASLIDTPLIDTQRLLRKPARAGKTRVVAIDGRSGAGKSSLAAVVRAELGAPVVTLEDLYGGWDGLERGIDLLVSDVLRPLAAGWAADVPRYDWVAREWAEPAVLEPPETLIVEGVGAGRSEVTDLIDSLIWVQADSGDADRRSLAR